MLQVDAGGIAEHADACRFPAFHFQDVERPGQRIEHGIKGMIAVGQDVGYLQPQIDLATGADLHVVPPYRVSTTKWSLV